nr:hypothetical protein [Tanacetum cinerariifolium]
MHLLLRISPLIRTTVFVTNQGYSPLKRINLDMDMKNLFNTQDYYVGQGSGKGPGGNQEFYTGQDYSMGQGSAPVEDDSPVEKEAMPVKATNVSERRQKIVTTENKESTKPWTTAEDVALCQASCDVSEPTSHETL